MQIISLLISAIFQVILFLIIPFVWWLFFGKNQENFFEWLGLKKLIIKDKTKYLLIFVSTIIVFLTITLLVIPFFVDKSTLATSQFSDQGISALAPALIYAFLQTGFSEELFFRGFLTKRLINKFGFQLGNLVQSLLFGFIHGLMFLSAVGLIELIIIILFTGTVGWLMGFINEKQSNGSIVSSWILHGCANTLVSILTMFNII